VFSPKLNSIYSQITICSFYKKIRFHPNDARGGSKNNGKTNTTNWQVIERMLRPIWKTASKLSTVNALWHLYLEQEFV
jgi:hypothetical protein